MAIYKSAEEWQAEGARRFGEDPLRWKLQCPVCGNVQTPEDFRKYKDKGATSDSAAVECIGRYSGGRRAFPSEEEQREEARRKLPAQPCNYAAFGLLSVGVDVVEFPEDDGTVVVRRKVFPFAEPKVQETPA